jgi:hypothetical protein
VRVRITGSDLLTLDLHASVARAGRPDDDGRRRAGDETRRGSAESAGP